MYMFLELSNRAWTLGLAAALTANALAPQFGPRLSAVARLAHMPFRAPTMPPSLAES
jgi:hypothetical protein